MNLKIYIKVTYKVVALFSKHIYHVFIQTNISRYGYTMRTFIYLANVAARNQLFRLCIE